MEKIKAIVIKSSYKKEKDVNVLLFSLEKGLVWATLKGVKNPKAKMKLAQNPFTFADFILEAGKSGNIITQFELIESFQEISQDIDKYFEASAVLEIVEKMDFSSQAERVGVFLLTVRTLKSICFGKVAPVYSLDKFLIELFKIYGFGLYSEKCTCCGTNVFDRLFLNYAVGELVCVSCRSLTSEELPRSTYLALKILDGNDFDRLKTIKLATGSETALLKILKKNFEARFDSKLRFMGVLS